MALYLINIFQRERDRLLLEIKKLACVPYVQNKKMQDVYSDKLNDLELQVGWYYNIDIFKVYILLEPIQGIRGAVSLVLL